jgi:uncharacterized protein YbjQ (UPF0145 family)
MCQFRLWPLQLVPSTLESAELQFQLFRSSVIFPKPSVTRCDDPPTNLGNHYPKPIEAGQTGRYTNAKQESSIPPNALSWTRSYHSHHQTMSTARTKEHKGREHSGKEPEPRPGAAYSESGPSSQGSPSFEEVPHSFTDTHGVITSTMNDIPGYRVVKVLGAVYGLTVRSRNWGADIGIPLTQRNNAYRRVLQVATPHLNKDGANMSGTFFKSAVGGELKYFTSMMYTSRNSAVERMVGECMGRGGNAVIALRFDAGEVGPYAQVCAYGTACVVEKVD